MKKVFIFLFVSTITLLLANLSYSQNPKDKVLIDSTGYVYITGQTKCTQDSDIVIIKYNPLDGSLVWQKKMGLQGNSFFRSAVIKGGYIYIAALNNYSGNKRAVVIRSDLNGNTINTFFDRPGGDYANAITTDNSGNVYVAGRTDFPVNFPKFLVIKYDSNLDSLWSYTYTGGLSGNFDEALDIKTDQNGNSFVTGYVSQGQTLYDSYDYLTMKLNPAGVFQWAKRYNGPSNRLDEPIGLVVDTASNSYVTGYSYSTAGCSYFTIKYSSTGDSLNSASYSCGSSSLNLPSAITMDNTGNIYVTGYGQCDAYNFYDYVTLKYNSSLVTSWSLPAVYRGPGNSIPYGIYYSNSKVYVTGESDSSNGDRKFLTFKYDAGTGNEIWRWYLNSSDSNYSASVAADQNDNVYVSGYSVPDTIISAKYTVWMSRYGYCPPFGIHTISTLVPKSFALYQNYPNPFNPSTLIKFDISKNTIVKIVIYDVLGKEVERVIDKQMAPGSYEEVWDGSDFESGVYFIQLTAGSYTESKKMVLIK